MSTIYRLRAIVHVILKKERIVMYRARVLLTFPLACRLFYCSWFVGLAVASRRESGIRLTGVFYFPLEDRKFLRHTYYIT